VIREAAAQDIKSITQLYKAASKITDGIARTEDEIDENLIREYFEKSSEKGLMFVAQNPQNPHEIIASIHCYKFDPKCFEHTLGNLIFVVHPNFHGQGIGTKIFTHLLEEIKTNHSEIARVELFVRESNKRAQALYQRLGFVIEGYLRNRIINSQGQLESDTIMGWMNPEYKSV
jgi:putative acetyltransferase